MLMAEGVIKCQVDFKYLFLHVRFFNCEYKPNLFLQSVFLSIRYTTCWMMLIKFETLHVFCDRLVILNMYFFNVGIREKNCTILFKIHVKWKNRKNMKQNQILLWRSVQAFK